MIMDMLKELEERINGLESRIAFQDREIEELNGVVTRQQDQIDRLLKDTKELIEQVKALEVIKTPDSPPHY